MRAFFMTGEPFPNFFYCTEYGQDKRGIMATETKVNNRPKKEEKPFLGTVPKN